MSTYLVTMANGHQAQWTIEYLLAAGAKVHALVRDPSTLTDKLARPGITVFGRDNENPEAIFKAAQGCKGVFLNTFPMSPEGPQAQLVLDACKKAGVESVVASTSFYTGDKRLWNDAECFKIMGWYYTSKANAEEVVRKSGMTYTILRPGFLHHNYLLPNVLMNYPDLPKSGFLGHAFNDGVTFQHIDEKDIGNYAAAALLDPVRFGGHEIKLCNEHLTVQEVRDIIAKVSQGDIGVKKFTADECEARKETQPGLIFQIFENIKPEGPATKNTAKATAKELEEKFGIPLTSLETYLEREKAELLACLDSAH